MCPLFRTIPGDGNRVKGTIGGTTTTYVGSYFEWTGSTTSMKKYYYAGTTRVVMRTGTSTINYLLGDHLGSQAITANSRGVMSAEIRYYPWGTERYTSGTTPTSYRFTGQRYESGIGLYFYGARWYDAYLNRWIQPDSIIPSNKTYSHLVVDYHETNFLMQLNQENLQQLLNSDFKLPPIPINSTAYDRYAYALNNPVIYTDPDGHNPLLVILGIIGAFIFFSQVPSDVYQPNPADWGDPGVMAFGGILMTVPAVGSYLCANDGDCTNEAQQLFNVSSKADARAAIKAGIDGLTNGQAQKALDILKGRRMDNIQLNLLTNGNTQIITQKMGDDGSSFVRWIYTLDPSGTILKVIQYGYNAAGELIHVDQKFP